MMQAYETDSASAKSTIAGAVGVDSPLKIRESWDRSMPTFRASLDSSPRRSPARANSRRGRSEAQRRQCAASGRRASRTDAIDATSPMSDQEDTRARTMKSNVDAQTTSRL